MQLISEEYRRLNAQKHEQSKAYGNNGGFYADHIRNLAREVGATSILDYGCGKRDLERKLGFAIANYDPAFPDLAAPPEPADIVACLDVLEHIEPDCIDAVLDHLASLIKMRGMFTIATAPAHKHLPDGRNAHLIIQPYDWWLPKFMQRWTLLQYMMGDKMHSFYVLVAPKAKA